MTETLNEEEKHSPSMLLGAYCYDSKMTINCRCRFSSLFLAFNEEYPLRIIGKGIVITYLIREVCRNNINIDEFLPSD